MLAYSTSPSADAAAAAPATGASSLLAGLPGTAMMTASASSHSGALVGPTVSRQPSPSAGCAVRASSRTIAPVRTVAPDCAATAGGSVPRPPDSVVKTGRAGAGGRPGPPGAGSRDAATSGSEATRRSTTSGPNLAPT